MHELRTKEMKVTKKWQIRVQRKLNKINIDEDTIFFSLTLFIGVFSGIVAVALKMATFLSKLNTLICLICI